MREVDGQVDRDIAVRVVADRETAVRETAAREAVVREDPVTGAPVKMPTRHVASRRSALIVLGLVILLVGAIFAIPAPTKIAPLVSSGLPVSYQSAQAELRQAALPSTGIAPAIVVYSSTDGAPLTEADRAAITARATALAPLSVGGQTAPPSFEP